MTEGFSQELVPISEKARAAQFAPRLLHVTLQHREQLPKLPSAFFGILGAFNAMMRVGMDQFFSQRLQAAPGGDDLHQNLRAVAVFIQHPLHRVELSDDLADADNRRSALLFRMVVMIFRHMRSVTALARFVKKTLVHIGYGGMVLLL